MSYQVALPSGRLLLTLKENVPHWSLDTLLDFATRRNPRRGFLFVSKVLGKHIPCRPSLILASHAALATQLPPLPPGLVWVLGLAETATALGAGVAQALAHQRGLEVGYQHTTRDAVRADLLGTFAEVHSHAPKQRLCLPQHLPQWRQTCTLVLVDDEISTGDTLRALLRILLPEVPQVRLLVLASLVNWMTPEQRRNLELTLPVQVRYAHLLAGTFEFMPAPGFSVQLPAPAELPEPRCVQVPGLRLGWRVGAPLALPTLPAVTPGKPVYIIGNGEFMYPPLCLAAQLEQAGHEVYFHSTTRSPILPGGPIRESLTFIDPVSGVQSYLHNPPPPGSTVFLALEQPGTHPLLTQPGWQPLEFSAATVCA